MYVSLFAKNGWTYVCWMDALICALCIVYSALLKCFFLLMVWLYNQESNNIFIMYDKMCQKLKFCCLIFHF